MLLNIRFLLLLLCVTYMCVYITDLDSKTILSNFKPALISVAYLKMNSPYQRKAHSKNYPPAHTPRILSKVGNENGLPDPIYRRRILFL